MTRIIDAEALKKALINAHINMVLTFDISTFNCVMNTIDNAPTVFDENAYSQGYKQGTCDSKNDRSTGKWNTHQVACILAELFGDTCACNYCGIDEWLPKKCDFANKECPDVVGVTCWEQFLKHRAKMKGGAE